MLPDSLVPLHMQMHRLRLKVLSLLGKLNALIFRVNTVKITIMSISKLEL